MYYSILLFFSFSFVAKKPLSENKTGIWFDGYDLRPTYRKENPTTQEEMYKIQKMYSQLCLLQYLQKNDSLINKTRILEKSPLSSLSSLSSSSTSVYGPNYKAGGLFKDWDWDLDQDFGGTQLGQ
jgi:hypothetical protein